MTFLSWDDTLIFDIPSIDEEHKKMVDFLNELEQAIVDKKEADVLEAIFDELASFTITHFSHEENVLEKHSFPELADHKKEHEAFISEVAAMEEVFIEGRKKSPQEVLNFLKKEIVDHIQGADKDFVPFLLERGVE